MRRWILIACVMTAALVVTLVAVQVIHVRGAARYEADFNRSVDRYLQLERTEAQTIKGYGQRGSADGFLKAMDPIHDDWAELENEVAALEPPTRYSESHQLFLAAVGERVTAIEELAAHPGSGGYAKRLKEADELCQRSADSLVAAGRTDSSR